MALGWSEWKASEEQYAFGLIERTIKALIEAGALPALPAGTMARAVFQLLGAAGIELAMAAEADKARVKDEYAQVLRYMLGDKA